MDNSFEITVKSSILDRDRKLALTEEYIEFEDKDLVDALPTRLEKTELSSLRHGIIWISGIHLTLGRVYVVEIKDIHGKEIKIRLKSLYGVRKKQLAEKYLSIVRHLYDLYFNSISQDYIDRFLRGEEFHLAGLVFTGEGIILQKKWGLLRGKTCIQDHTNPIIHYLQKRIRQNIMPLFILRTGKQ